MNDEKVIVEDYEVMERTVIGTDGYFLAEYVGKGRSEKYATGFIDRSKLMFDLEQYQFNMFSNDYLDVAKIYHESIITKIDELKEMMIQMPKELYTTEHCIPLNTVSSIAGEIVVQSVDVLFPEYRNASNQIYLATSGNGCKVNGGGSAVYATNLYNGEHTRLERCDLLGILKKEHMTEWARTKYEKIQSQKNKERER